MGDIANLKVFGEGITGAACICFNSAVYVSNFLDRLADSPFPVVVIFLKIMSLTALYFQQILSNPCMVRSYNVVFSIRSIGSHFHFLFCHSRF